MLLVFALGTTLFLVRQGTNFGSLARAPFDWGEPIDYPAPFGQPGRRCQSDDGCQNDVVITETPSPTPTPTPTATPTMSPTPTPNSKNLLSNTSFEEGAGTRSGPKDFDPKKWLTVEGVTVRGTGREQFEKPNLVQTLCVPNAPITPQDGNCLLKVQSGVGVKANVTQSYNPTVIDGTFIQNVSLYIPKNQNENYIQQLELREGVLPGPAGDIIKIYYSDKKFMVCNVSGENTCRNFAPLSPNIWHNLRIIMVKQNPNTNIWSLKVDDLTTKKVYWNSDANLGGTVKLLSIPRERISPQIGTLFFGDECLGSTGVATGCDGTGVVYYDQVKAENINGTGRYSQQIPADANDDKTLNINDFEIWKDNFMKILQGQTVNPNNSTGDFRADNIIDGRDFATWWNRVGQTIQQ